MSLLAETMLLSRVYFSVVALFTIFALALAYEVERAHLPQPSRPIRLIAVDIDGTLTKNEKFVEKNIEGFKLAKKLGIEVVFVTGRDPESAKAVVGRSVMEEVDYPGYPGVYVNGAYVVDRDGLVLVDGPLSKDLQERLLQSFGRHGLNNVVFGETPKGGKGHLREKSDSDSDQYTLAVFEEPSKIDDVLPHLVGEFREEVEFTRWAPHAVSVHRMEFSKGSGLIALLQQMHIPSEEVLALGNGVNDLPLFEVAATSVCVGDGEVEAVQAADYITVNSDEGALLAIVREIEKNGYYPGAFERLQRS